MINQCASVDCKNTSIGTTEVKMASYPTGKIRIVVCLACYNKLQGMKLE